MKKYISKIKEFWVKNETKIVLSVGFLLASSLSFEAGVLWGQKWQSKPLVIEKQIDVAQGTEVAKIANSEVSGSISETKSTTQNIVSSTSSCTYVGSKNSTKFYLSTCSWAKKIKPENLICFPSPEEALKQGRTESKCN